jgi:hypothetical protein
MYACVNADWHEDMYNDPEQGLISTMRIVDIELVVSAGLNRYKWTRGQSCRILAGIPRTIPGAAVNTRMARERRLAIKEAQYGSFHYHI